MKFFTKLFIALILLLPISASAVTAVPWSITNLTDTFIFPNLVNGLLKGILVSASSTIGAGTQTSGLTINGGATTTGFINVQGNATSTFFRAVQSSCFTINGTTCLSAGTGTVTQINTTFPIQGGPITTSGTLTFGGLSTTSPWTAGQLAMVVNNNTVGGVATGTIAAGTGISLTPNMFVIGSGGSITNTGVLFLKQAFGAGLTGGLSMATATAAFNGLTLGLKITDDSSSIFTFTPTATGVLTEAGGGTSESTYTKGDTLYASAANTLDKLAIGTGGFILSVVNGVPGWVATSSINNGVTSVATNNGLTGGTITTTGTIGLATIGTGTGLANGTGGTAIPTAIATSSWFGIGTNGFVLAEVQGVPTWVATTTLSTISGLLNLTTQVTGILPIANGGTNANAFGTTNGIVAYDGTRQVNFAGYTLTSILATMTNASTTAFSSVYASSTLANFGTLTLPNLANGCLNVTSGLVGSTGSACGSGGGGGTNTDKWATSTVDSTVIFPNSARAIGIGTNNPLGVNVNSLLTIATTSSADGVASTTDNTTLSDAIWQAYAPGSRIFLGAHGTNQITTQYGITVGGWGEIGAINSTFGTSNGLLIGTRTTAKPIVFGTNSLERARIDSSGNFLIGTTTGSDILTVSSSSAVTVLTNASGAMFTLVNTNTTDNTFSDHAFSTVDTLGATVVAAKMAVQFISHTAGAISADFAWFTRSAGTLAERMRLTAAGALGLNDTTPDFKFEAVGTSGNGYFGLTNVTDGDIFSVLSNGNVGIGSSTPWGQLGIASSTFNGFLSQPLLAISTSSNQFGSLLNVFATSSVLNNTLSNFANLFDSGARVLIGTNNQNGIAGGLDQLYVNGRINTGDWNSIICDFALSSTGSVTATTGNTPCQGILFAESTDASYTLRNNDLGAPDSGILNINAIPNNSGAVMFGGVSSDVNPWLRSATTTSVMEVIVRWDPTTSTSTSIYIGYKQNINTIAAPTSGCFITASSSAATGNWYAISEKNGGAGTMVNTGFASSTVQGLGNYYRVRIEFSSSACNIYMQPTNGNMVLVGSFGGNTIASTTTLAPEIQVFNVTAAVAQLYIKRLRFWWTTGLQ